MEHLIGVVGSSGKVGEALSEILSEKYKVLGGQRHPKKTIENENFSYQYLDIFDDSSLEDFCSKCSIIVNCAGPSYVIKNRIAAAAAKHNAGYDDLSGDMLFDDEYKDFIKNSEGSFLVGTGYVAGLSAILPTYFSKKYFDNVESVKCCQGSREMASRNSIIDIILSSVSNSGYPNCFYDRKNIKPELIDTENKANIVGFPESVFLKPYLSNEMKRMAEISNIGQLHWYNAIPDSEISDIANNMFSADNVSLIESNSEKIQNYLKIYNAIANSRPLWNCMVYEICGTKNEKSINKRIICHIKSGYKVCGVVASLAVESLIENPVKGLHWGFEVIDGEETFERLSKYDAIENIICNDFDSSDFENGIEEEFEEDVL